MYVHFPTQKLSMHCPTEESSTNVTRYATINFNQVTDNEQQIKIQVFLGVMPWLANSHQCHSSWTAWLLTTYQSTYHNISKDLNLQQCCQNWKSCITEHLNPLHAGQAICWPQGLLCIVPSDNILASILSVLGFLLIHDISAAITSLNSVIFYSLHTLIFLHFDRISILA
jgi:hypothetical protein